MAIVVRDKSNNLIIASRRTKLYDNVYHYPPKDTLYLYASGTISSRAIDIHLEELHISFRISQCDSKYTTLYLYKDRSYCSLATISLPNGLSIKQLQEISNYLQEEMELEQKEPIAIITPE